MLCVFWVLVLWGSEGQLLQETWTAGDVLAVLLFASVPVMLVAAGCLLCPSRADARLRLGALAITAVLLIAKALLACHWAFAALQHQDVSLVGSLFRGLFFWALVVFVIAPSGGLGPRPGRDRCLDDRETLAATALASFSSSARRLTTSAARINPIFRNPAHDGRSS